MFDEHPLRLSLTNELHARPYQLMRAPGRVLMLAFKQQVKAAERDPAVDRRHLIELLDQFGVAHPPPDANHHTVDAGRFVLSWERHTEFVSYTIYEQGPTDALFAGNLAAHFPQDWLNRAPGKAIAAAQCELMAVENREDALELLRGPLSNHFRLESLAASWIANRQIMALGDFRIHEGRYGRFALIKCGEVGPRRIGRACQRLLEVDVYRTLSMLSFPLAKKVAGEMNKIERSLAEMVRDVAEHNGGSRDDEILAALTELSAEIEAIAADTAFRFGAGGAYEALVKERVSMLSEERVEGRQLFREFMLRRFEPAMRTVQSAERRLAELATRTSRVAQLLRTRVNVALEAQNQDLLESMNRRADLQLRLQRTVEGLSVVAISYYAVSLAGYILAPVGDLLGVDKAAMTALATIPIILGVWMFVRRIRERLESGKDS
ncbi:MAG: DUF3422 domain-containing protein [Pseudomonadota bacterium]